MLDISSNAATVSVTYQNASKLVAKTVFKALTRLGLALVAYVKQQKLSGSGIGPAGDGLHYRTRTLSRSIYSRVDLDGRDAVLYLGADISKAPYARVQEYGGTITPKNAQFLTIPVGVNLTGNGVMRVSPREFIANPSSLGFETSFVNKRKTAIMGASRGQTPEPVFALRTSVTLPERSYIRSSVSERANWIRGQLGAGAGEGLTDAINGGTGI